MTQTRRKRYQRIQQLIQQGYDDDTIRILTGTPPEVTQQIRKTPITEKTQS